jgi:hypothetical protein
MRPLLRSMVVASCLSVLAPTIAGAQQPAAAAPAADNTAELAQKLSNPISDLVSIPFQFNWYQHVGPLELSTFILNVQPVIPLKLNDDWNLILRIIVPFIGQPPLFRGDVSTFGIGDMTTSFFFSPKSIGGFTWGVGPVFETPSSYQPTIGSGHYNIGPTGVALQQTGKWTIGALVNQAWSVAGDRRREDVNHMFLQPFLAYQATPTLALTVNSETTANWP